jgi:uncharacterized membrane protein YkoI
MNKFQFAAFGLVAALGLTPAVVNASQTKEEPKKVETKESKSTESAASAEQAKLQKEAKISMDQAKEIALKHVKNGKIESSELERENGKLIYSFDIREAARKDVTEVNVDAMNGKIVAIEHESPKKEAIEKKQEAKEKH